NTRDKLLGAEERTISLKQAIMQMAEEERKLILSARTYGSDAIKVRQIVTDLGVSYEDASVSLSRYASLLEDVTLQERILHKERLLAGDFVKEAQKKTVESVKVLAFEASKVRLKEIEEEVARYEGDKKM